MTGARTHDTKAGQPLLHPRRLGVLTSDDPVVFMHEDCHVCRSEGSFSRSRVLLTAGGRSVVAMLCQVTSDIVAIDEAGLSEAAWLTLGVADGEVLTPSHPAPLISFRVVRSRIFGNRLIEAARHLDNLGGPPSVCVAVHAIFATDKYSRLSDAATRIVTNTVPHASNDIDVSALVATSVEEVLTEHPALSSNDRRTHHAPDVANRVQP